MAFVISKATKYSWPVQLEIPVDGGKHEKQTFDAEFKRIPQSKIKEILDGIKSESITDDVALARDLMVGWAGVKDNENNDIPFSEKSFSELLDIPGVAGAIVKTFFESLAGARRKN